MTQIRDILKNGGVSTIEGRGRLHPDVRETAARTQVPINLFRQCPNCSEPMDDQFIHLDVELDSVDFHCEACGKTGKILDTGHIEYYSSQNEFSYLTPTHLSIYAAGRANHHG